MTEHKYEIVEKYGVLSESAKGWKKELNLISWNGREPKYDLRDWSEDHEKMGKGSRYPKKSSFNLRIFWIHFKKPITKNVIGFNKSIVGLGFREV